MRLIKGKFISYSLTFLCSLTLILSFSPFVKAQIPFIFPQDAINELPQTPAWDLNRAEPCGRFLCSRVFFFGDGDLLGERIILAVPRDRTKTTREVALEVEQRARFIQNVFIGVFNNLRPVVRISPIEKRKNRQFWLITSKKPFHSATPIVEVGIENGQTVVYVVRQKELGLPQQAIATITEVDANANFMTIEQLAQAWRLKIRQSFSNALWGLEMDVQRPFLRFNFSIFVLTMALLLVFLEKKINKLLKKRKRNLQEKLEEINETLKINPETTTSKNITTTKRQLTTEKEEINSPKSDLESDSILTENIFIRGINNSKQLISEGLSFSVKLLPEVFVQRQNLIKQQINFIELFSSLIFLSQITVIFLAIAIITVTFRETRFLFNLFFTQALSLPFIWIAMILADKITDFWIDSALHDWAKEKQELQPYSNRPILRVNTYSPALRKATTVLFTIIGIFLTLGVIGLDVNVLAGAGALAVLFAFLSRNILDDLLNGTLILITDRYALGDFVEINKLAGFVETMNLYTTSLRNLDGQLITIPNGQVKSVINMTKNWSRVNFTIQVSWDANLQQTMNILKSVADQMYKEPEWREKMFDTADILGIDQIDHNGVLIRVLIKTLPLQQWAVGREYRWRVKEAFQRSGISLGIPQNQIWYNQNYQ